MDLNTPSSSRDSDNYSLTSRSSILNGTLESTQTSSGMLSIDLATPLAGQARSERIKQMCRNHAAFEKSRVSQEILVKISQSLRRMPGVSSSESGEIISQLKEVGQGISQETSALVDALMNVTLDQEDTDKAVARMGIELNLANVEADKHREEVQRILGELDAEREKRKDAEKQVSRIFEDLQSLSAEFRALKSRPDREDATSPKMIQKLEETIKHLDDQVNNRRSLWLMKNTDPSSVARAIATLADSVQDNQAARRALMCLKPALSDDSQSDDSDITRLINEFPTLGRSSSTFQPIHRSSSVAPPKMGQFHIGAGRPGLLPTVNPRHFQGHWNGNGNGNGNGHASSNHQPRQNHHGNAATSMSSFSRMTTRQTSNPAPRFSPTAVDSQPWSYSSGELQTQRASSYSTNMRDCNPKTPTAPSRGRYNRMLDAPPPTPEYTNGMDTSNAIVARHSVGPLLHTSEQLVQSWHDSVMELYGLTRTFVERHTIDPSSTLASKVSNTPLWQILLATYFPLSEAEGASYLEYHLRSENSKSCLITRVIIDYIVNRVWVPGAWAGSDHESTGALLELEAELEKMHGQPSSLRQPLLDHQAIVVNAVLQREKETNFCKAKIEEITRTLLTSLQPLLDKQTNAKEAYRNMERIAESAWDLSARIMTSRLTFDFRFPEIGSRFSSQSMLPIWPTIDPLELQAKHWRVALVTTPVITCRNDTGTNISAHSVSLADVFCMQ